MVWQSSDKQATSVRASFYNQLARWSNDAVQVLLSSVPFTIGWKNDIPPIIM